jgi:hypothetical protein
VLSVDLSVVRKRLTASILGELSTRGPTSEDDVIHRVFIQHRQNEAVILTQIQELCDSGQLVRVPGGIRKRTREEIRKSKRRRR